MARRYIDADALAKVLFDMWQECDDIKILIPAIRNVIKCAGISDVVTVVRCKECKHFYKNCSCVKPDFFCAYGERRENEESTKRTD